MGAQGHLDGKVIHRLSASSLVCSRHSLIVPTLENGDAMSKHRHLFLLFLHLLPLLLDLLVRNSEIL